MKQEIMTIHEVRKRLDRSLELAENINRKFLNNEKMNERELRSLYEYLRRVNSAKWTNSLL